MPSTSRSRRRVAKSPAEPEPEVAELAEASTGESQEFEIEVESEAETPQEQLEGFNHAAPVHQEHLAEQAPADSEVVEAGDLSAFVSDLEKSLGDAFPEAETVPAAASPTQAMPAWPQTAPSRPKAPPAAPVPPPRRMPEPEPVAHSEIPVAPSAMPAVAASVSAAAAGAATLSYTPTTVRPLGAGAQAMHPQDSVDLSEMFGELKHELEEDVATADEDPETHYNLGVAFREMGLLDEAIAELQKVCNSIERGHQFAQIVQTYTWLAQCFIDKGVPDAAIRWFEKALTIPGLDQEARLAIHYELGSACEAAQDKPAALRHFTAVYGGNIDYRDVGERIQALKS